MTAFPDADPAAIGALADSLRGLSVQAAATGLDTENVRASVMSSQQWQGAASEKWYTVVTGRIDDASLTSEVMGSVSRLLSNLAGDLESERKIYDGLSAELNTVTPVYGVQSRFTGPDVTVNPGVQRAMDKCAERAAELLEGAARQLLSYAVLAEDVRAVPVAGRTPGVAPGANRQAASLELLAMLFGSVTGGRLTGTKFENAVLQALGMPKNNDVYRPDPPFEGKLTASGLAKGVIPDSESPYLLVEVKGTKSLQSRFQIRLEAKLAEDTGRPLWIIKAGIQKADTSVTQAAEDTQGGVLYTSDNGRSFTDGKGNPVNVTYDKSSGKIEVQGYVRSTGPQAGGGGLGSAQSPDSGAPSAPENPNVASGSAGTAPEAPVGPEDPAPPPVDPEIIP